MMNLRFASAVAVACLAAGLLAGCGGGSGTSFSSDYGTVVGTVVEPALFTDANSLPSAGGATVRVEGAQISASVGPDGRFVLENVPVGLHTVVAANGAGWGAAALCVSVQRGRQTNLGQIVLRDTGQISGIVTSQATGSPIAGARVTVIEEVESTTDQMPHPVRIAYTDAAGSYTVSWLAEGNYVVTIEKRGYEAASLYLAVSPRTTTNGDVALASLPEAGTGAIQGTASVRNEDGTISPLAGALIRLANVGEPVILSPLPPEMNSYGDSDQGSSVPAVDPPIPPVPYREYYAITGEDGTYLIEGVPEGRYVIIAIRPGFEAEQKEVEVVAGQTSTVDFVLTMCVPRAGVVEGKVTDSQTDAPIAGARVMAVVDFAPPPAVPTSGTTPDRWFGFMGGVVCPDPRICLMETLTDADGYYKLLFPDFVTRISVSADGYVPAEAPVSIVPGGSVTVNVALTPQ